MKKIYILLHSVINIAVITLYSVASCPRGLDQDNHSEQTQHAAGCNRYADNSFVMENNQRSSRPFVD